VFAIANFIGNQGAPIWALVLVAAGSGYALLAARR
jgi:hypothetical protein